MPDYVGYDPEDERAHEAAVRDLRVRLNLPDLTQRKPLPKVGEEKKARRVRRKGR